MSRIRGSDTKPEMRVRRALHARGLRYRLHRRDLPGTPDIVFPRAKVAVFVHGCYWHRHESCRLTTTPSTNTEFWQRKFDGNVARDRKAAQQLVERGWQVMTVWECETRKPAQLQAVVDRIEKEIRSRVTPNILVKGRTRVDTE